MILKPQIIDGRPYYVISMSGFAAFKRCRKSFDLSYARGYEPRDLPSVVEAGRSFHEHVAAIATGAYDVLARVEQGDEMAAIAWAYAQARPIPSGDDVLIVEEPIYVKLLEQAPTGQPGVIMRCTVDIAYRNSDFIVLRDYKTFDRAPSLHVDLDFQGRIYVAAAMRYFQTKDVFFEFEYVRRTLPNVPKDKSGGVWSENDCYINVPLVVSEHEAGVLWTETQYVANNLRKILTDYDDHLARGAFYREDLKVGPHACSSCFMRHGCVSEVQQGVLTPEQAEHFYTIRQPIVIPPNTKIV